MTKLDELIEQLQSDPQVKEAMGDLLDELVAARVAMNDPSDASEADEIAKKLLQEHIKGALGAILQSDEVVEADAEYMEKTAEAVEEVFVSQGWKGFGKRYRRNDLLQYEMGFNINGISIRVSVFIEDRPKRIRIHATLPIAGEKTYEYLLSKAVVDANHFIYGAFKYDPRDGEITCEQTYPITHGFYKDDFLHIFHAVVRTAVDDDAYAAIKKATTGSYKRNEREMILDSIEKLHDDLADY